MFLKIYPENPSESQIKRVVDILKQGGIIIYPTDSVYGIGCDIYNHKAVEKVAKIKGLKIEKANFSIICYDLSHLSEFTKPIDNHIYKVMRRNLPGPFTFILPASKKVPKIFDNKKKTIGIRVPNNNIPREIVKELGNPILTTSIHDDDEILEYITDPELIYEKYQEIVDAVIDGGYGEIRPTTIVDCSQGDIEIIREGIAVLDF